MTNTPTTTPDGDGPNFAAMHDDVLRENLVLQERLLLAEGQHAMCADTDRTHQERIGALESQVNDLEHDLRVIAAQLVEEADSRDWCGEYDEWVDRVNSLCTSRWLKPCRYNLETSLRVDLTIAADDEEAAQAVVAEIIDRVNAMRPERASYRAFDVYARDES